MSQRQEADNFVVEREERERLSTSRAAARWVAGIACLAFVALGFATGLLGVAWPSIRAQFRLELDAVNAVFIVSNAAYVVASLPVGRIVRKLGTARAVIAGAAVLGAGSLCVAAAGRWPWVVAAMGLASVGSGVLDASLNLYVTRHYGPRQMLRLHAAFGVGATAGPAVMTLVLRRHAPWQIGYAIGGAAMLLPIAAVAMTYRRWRDDAADHATTEAATPMARSLRVPGVWLGIALFTICVGLELGVGQWAYTVLTASRGLRPDVAGFLVSAHWAAFTGGRILFAVIGDRINASRLLSASLVVMLLAAAAFWRSPWAGGAIGGLLLFALAEAPLFPLLMNATRRRAGAEHTDNAVGLQMAATGVTSALCPALVGVVGQHLGVGAMGGCFVALCGAGLGLYCVGGNAREREPSGSAAGSLAD